MSNTYIDLYQALFTIVNNPKADDSALLPSYNKLSYAGEEEELNSIEKTNEFFKNHPNVNIKQYNSFVIKVKDGENPASIFLNQLVKGHLSSPSPLKSYEKLMNYWVLSGANEEENKIALFQEENKDWFNKETQLFVNEELLIAASDGHQEIVKNILDMTGSVIPSFYYVQ